MSTLQGLPEFPDDTLDTKVYNALLSVHLALKNLDQALSLGTGLEAYPSSDWSTQGLTGSFTIGNASRMYCKAATPITAGMIIGLVDSGTEMTAFPAIATAENNLGKGLCTVGGSGIIEFQWLRGWTNLIGGITPGAKYFLSDATPGLIQVGRPVTVGHWIQPIGIGIYGSTLIYDMPVTGNIIT